MDIVTELVELVRDVIRSYATHGYSGGQPFRLYYVENQQDQVFSVVAPYDPIYERADLVIMARIVDNQVIIDIDRTSVSVYEALKRAGIPENQIIIASKTNHHYAAQTDDVSGPNELDVNQPSSGDMGSSP